jgi:hypothetical protein
LAIHDATYPTRPTTLREFRWRLLFLFEERVGKRISESRLAEEAREQAAVENLKRVLG